MRPVISSGRTRRVTIARDSIAPRRVSTTIHPPQRMTLKQSYDMWNDSFVDAMVPDYEFAGKKELRAKLTTEFVDQIWDLPRQTGYNNYMARTYGVPPTLEGFDSVVSKHIKSDTDFTAYVKSILDRENISTVVLQSAEADPILPPSFIPRNRFVWTYPIVPLVHPAWAQKKSATTLQDVLDQIDKTMETAVANRCASDRAAPGRLRDSHAPGSTGHGTHYLQAEPVPAPAVPCRLFQLQSRLLVPSPWRPQQSCGGLRRTRTQRGRCPRESCHHLRL